MWPSQLQEAEEMTCLGWLLFSMDEMDKEALCNEIWQMTGVQVALQFQAIDDGIPKKTKHQVTRMIRRRKKSW